MNFEDIPKMIRHLGRTLFGSAPTAPVTDLTGKNAIVTGASPGSIGFETAKTLASWGANVIITTRSNPGDTVQALVSSLQREGKTANIKGHTLDLTNAQSVNTFAEWFQDISENRLHILINNAGIHLDLLSQWKEPTLTSDGFEIHWRTNYLGSAMLTHLLLPQLKNAGAIDGDARVVNVSSHLHSKGLNSELMLIPKERLSAVQAVLENEYSGLDEKTHQLAQKSKKQTQDQQSKSLSEDPWKDLLGDE